MSPRLRYALIPVCSFLFVACASTSQTEDSTVSASTIVTTDVEASESTTPETDASIEASAATSEFPDIVAAEASLGDDGTWRFDVTVSSPYDSPDRYADAWRVVGPDGSEYGIRVLTHDHASEQPFTRSQDGIEIPDDVVTVTIEGRDLVNGWGGGTLDLDLPPT